MIIKYPTLCALNTPLFCVSENVRWHYVSTAFLLEASRNLFPVIPRTLARVIITNRSSPLINQNGRYFMNFRKKLAPLRRNVHQLRKTLGCQETGD